MNNIGLDHIRNDFIYNFKHSFNDYNDDIDNSSPYYNIGHNCEYYDIEKFSEKVSGLENQTSFFSMNIRSLPGKWNEFPHLVDSLNKNEFKFTVISMTEIWNIPPNVIYELPGYSPLHFSIRDKTVNRFK